MSRTCCPRSRHPHSFCTTEVDRLIPFRGAQQLVAGLRNARLVTLDGRVHLPDARNLDQIQKNIVEHVRGAVHTQTPQAGLSLSP